MPQQLVRVRIGMFFALCMGVVVLGGCNPPPAPCFPVSGKVIWQKKGLPSGAVNFTPDASKGNNLKEGPMGVIGADGTYTLSTNGRSGAPLGWYKVTISTIVPPGESVTTGQAMPKPVNIPGKYSKPDSSGISIEVTENPKPGQYDIELK